MSKIQVTFLVLCLVGLALTMPTPKAYEPSSQNFEGPHSAGDNYIKSFSADELKVRKHERYKRLFGISDLPLKNNYHFIDP